MHALAISYTVDFGPKVLSEWLLQECPHMRWHPFLDAKQRELRIADAARALLGFLQLTMEDHLEDMDPGSLGRSYLPKYAAAAIWEHAEHGIRSIAPCVGCANTEHRMLRCPNGTQACLGTTGHPSRT